MYLVVSTWTLGFGAVLGGAFSFFFSFFLNGKVGAVAIGCCTRTTILVLLAEIFGNMTVLH